MNANLTLTPATIYRVHIRGQKRALRRIFKWSEKRFGKIPCFVFSSPSRGKITATRNGEELLISGRNIPASEVSVPHYDLLYCQPEHDPCAVPGVIPAIVKHCGQGAADKFAEKSGALDLALDRMIDEAESEATP